MPDPTPQSYTPPPLPSPFSNTTPPPALLTQGAEAHLYKTSHLSPSTPAALKIRPPKPYRHPILDRRLTRQRILHEARCLSRLVKEGVCVPALLALDWEGDPSGSGGAWLLMEWVEGVAVRTVFERWEGWIKRQGLDASGPLEIHEEEKRRVSAFMARIGRLVGGLHKAGVVHGDLTTSNLMLRDTRAGHGHRGQEENPPMDGDIVLIDFGLSVQSSQDEDRAVDLYVLERAFGSTHPRTEPFFEFLLQGYRESYKGAGPALKRLEDVRMRGRKRSMIG